MLKKVVCLLVGAFGTLVQAQNPQFTFSLNESFIAPVLDNDSWVGGGSGIYLARENKTTLIDTGLGEMSKYRYMSLGPAKYMDGDFEAEVDFAFQRLDHWNALSLNVSALDGSWSAAIARKQNNPGVHLLATRVTQQGKTQEKETAETSNTGILKINRTGSKLQLSWKPKNGQWKNLADMTVGQGPVSACVYVTSANSTRSVIQLNHYKQSWQKDLANYQYPIYGNSKVLAEWKSNGGIYLMRVEKGVEQAGAVELEPGGRAVFATEAPLNTVGMSLNWESQGAIKVSATQVGTAEPIELGLTVLWDEQRDPAKELTARGVSLDPFLSRFPDPKRISFTHRTSNNVLFVTIQPSVDQKVVLKNLKLHGACLLPIKPFAADRTVKSQLVSQEGFNRVDWTPTADAKDWWGSRPLPAGKTVEMCGIPFKICPTIVDKKLPAVEIAVNQKAGLFHFAHGVNDVAEGRDWVGSYLIVYDDDNTETIFADLGWNCGSYTGQKWAQCDALNTWWGPTRFTFANLHYLPRPGLGRGVFWDGVYVATYLNPHPEKTVRKIIVYSPPNGVPFALVGLTLTPPERARLSLVEPHEAAFMPGKELRADVMIRSAEPMKSANGELLLAKSDRAIKLGQKSLAVKGPFGFAAFYLTPKPDLMEPGAVTLRYREGEKNLAESSLLGWMPAPDPADRPCYLSMICGGFESRWEFERMRRLGYDAIKAQMGWEQVEPRPGKFDFSQWKLAIPYVHREGLDVSVRNSMGVPSWLMDKVSWRVNSTTGKVENDGYTGHVDMGDPAFIEAVTRHYAAVARFLKQYPYVFSINANYGTRGGCGVDGMLYYGPKFHMPAFRKLLTEKFTLAEVVRRTGLKLSSFEDLTPEKILADKTGLLLEYYVRAHDRNQSDLFRRVIAAIRETGNRSHLVFNVAMHDQWNTLNGQPLDHYLQIGLDYPPASPFHESCDRYSLSFAKWLAAKRTFDLPYGDEGNRNPPPHEQNLRSYEWMMMFQCREALYCQWWNGKPGSQNVAFLKPYYRMIYNAEYLPDPITLAFSFESGFAESFTEWKESRTQKPAMCHYGLANTLRALNFNADRYVMDHFPQTDARAGKFLIDDISRFIDDGFADRLEKFIRNGGAFVASPGTDLLRDHRFLKRFGVGLTPLDFKTAIILDGRKVTVPGAKYKITGDGLTILAEWDRAGPAAAVKSIGKGKLLVFGKTWSQDDYDLNLPDEYLALCRKTLTRFGQFQPNVRCDTWQVSTTPYRTRDGHVLVNLYNDTVTEKTVTVSIRKDLVSKTDRPFDLGRGIPLPLRDAGEYWQTSTTVPLLRNTVIVFENKS